MSDREETRSFRTWLIDRVAETPVPHGWSDQQVADALGVQVDVVAAARKLVAERLRMTSGERAASLRRYRSVAQAIRAPLAIHEDLTAYATARGLGPEDILRGSVHYYLSVPAEPGVRPHAPEGLPVDWMYRGRVLPKDRANPRGHNILVARMSRGAALAMTRRAKARGKKKSDFLRGCILDVLEGRLRTFSIVTLEMMYDEPDHYWRPDAASH